MRGLPDGLEEEFEPEALGETYDAFAPENIGTVHFIQLGRIYDVLMGIYTHLNPVAAENLLNLHLEGSLMGPSPLFNGKFVSDEIAQLEELESDTPPS